MGTKDGGIEWFRHVFPVRGPHGERGAVGEFGVPRSGGRWHEGFDILAACGTELVSAVTGKVREVGYDPILYGVNGHPIDPKPELERWDRES